MQVRGVGKRETQNISDLDGKIKTKEPHTLKVCYVKKEGQG